jgi:hypothetical protein
MGVRRWKLPAMESGLITPSSHKNWSRHGGQVSGELVISESELLATHYLSPGLRSQVLCPAKALVFKSLPRLQSLCLARSRMGLVGA